MRKKTIMLVLIVVSLIFVATTITAEERKRPTYEELFEQQLRMYETKRYIERSEKEKETLEEELPLLKASIEEKQTEVANQMEEVKPILLKLYSGQDAMWAELYLQLETLEDVMTVYHVSEKYTEEQMNALNSLNEELKSLEKEEKEWLEKSERLETLLNSLTEQLTILEKDEETYAYKMGLVEDVERAKRGVAALIERWETKGLVNFNELFNVMAKSIANLPSAVDKSAIKMKNLFTYEASISDKELNDYLQKEEEIFEQIKLTFDDGLLQMAGAYDGLSFEAKGYYEIVSGEEMQFHLTNLEFEGISLPSVTLLELQETYDLGFYPSTILEGAKVKKLEMEDGVFRVEVSL